MANANPACKFPKGNKLGGRPKNLLTRQDVKRVSTEIARMTEDEVRALLDNPKAAMIDKTIARVFMTAYVDGDHVRLNFLLDRTIGKARDEIYVEIDEPDRKKQRELEHALMRTPEALAAVSVLAAAAAKQQLQLDDAQRLADRNRGRGAE